MMKSRRLKESLENLAELQDVNTQLRHQLHAVNQWTHAMMKFHQPYVAGRVDVSSKDVDDLAEELLETAGRQLFCTGCSGTWPCANIPRLRLLREVTDCGVDLGEVLDLINTIKPRPRSGTIETAI